MKTINGGDLVLALAGNTGQPVFVTFYDLVRTAILNLIWKVFGFDPDFFFYMDLF